MPVIIENIEDQVKHTDTFEITPDGFEKLVNLKGIKTADFNENEQEISLVMDAHNILTISLNYGDHCDDDPFIEFSLTKIEV